MKHETIDMVIRHYGSQRNLARALCVTEGAVSQWVKAGAFPAAQAVKIERVFPKVRAIDLTK